ncbi:hypothetical protein D3C72_1445710 [compost metagenome]
MIVYHEVNSDSLGAVLNSGLICTSRGSKGNDRSIIAADHYLDERCPVYLKERGMSRDNNVYAYVSSGDSIVDITNGDLIPLQEFISRSNQSVLELSVDASRCYVSDLDTYDAIMTALENHEDQYIIDQLASSYWNKIIVLKNFSLGSIRRPEIMITYDVPPSMVRLVS